MRQGSTISGLTTAASLWVVAGIGLAVGIGLVVPALITTALVLISLVFFDRFARCIAERRDGTLQVSVIDGPGVLGCIGTILGQHSINIRSVHMEVADDLLLIRFVIRTPAGLDFPEVTRLISTCSGVQCVEWII